LRGGLVAGPSNSTNWEIVRKTIVLGLWLLCIAGVSPAFPQLIYGVSSTHDSLFVVDSTSWSVTARRHCTLVGDSILGMHGLAFDPIGHGGYTVLTLNSSPNSRKLATIDWTNGICSVLGDLGDKFSAITFREDGQMLGVVHDNGNAAADLFLIDKMNANTSFATHFSNGDSGEVVCFHPDDAMLYHWSGSTNRVMEKLIANIPFSTPTPIPMSGSTSEIVGALDLGNQYFLVSDAAHQLRHVSADGLFGNVRMTTPVDFTGMLMPPTISLADAIVCIGDTVVVNFKGVAADSAFFDWNDSSMTTTFPAGTATHTYSTAGNYVIQVGLKNPFVGLDTLLSLNLRVNALPGVFLNPSHDTLVCLEDTLYIAATFGGTSRWFRNGILIPGPHTNVHPATLNGWYNMAKTNMNGCTDSAALGISVVFANQMPEPMIAYDSTDCPTIAFEAQFPFSSSWQWTFGDGGSSSDSLASHTYSSVGIYPVTLVTSNACKTDTAFSNISINCPIARPESFQRLVKVAPNPNSGNFILHLDLPAAKPLNYRILDMTGRECYSKIHPSPQRTWSEEVHSELPAGIYLLQIEAGPDKANFRMVVK
jgi:hypothetical protein